ncbi:hypothetical protein [Francisella salimarina]
MKLYLYTSHYKLICEVACGYGGGLKWISDHINAQVISFVFFVSFEESS